MKHMLLGMTILGLCAGGALAQTSDVGVALPLGSTEFSTPGLSPGRAGLPLPGTQFGFSSMAATEYGSSLAAPNPSSPFGIGDSDPVNRRITNYGTGGMQLPPGSPPGSNR